MEGRGGRKKEGGREGRIKRGRMQIVNQEGERRRERKGEGEKLRRKK